MEATSWSTIAILCPRLLDPDIGDSFTRGASLEPPTGLFEVFLVRGDGRPFWLACGGLGDIPTSYPRGVPLPAPELPELESTSDCLLSESPIALAFGSMDADSLSCPSKLRFEASFLISLLWATFRSARRFRTDSDLDRGGAGLDIPPAIAGCASCDSHRKARKWNAAMLLSLQKVGASTGGKIQEVLFVPSKSILGRGGSKLQPSTRPNLVAADACYRSRSWSQHCQWQFGIAGAVVYGIGPSSNASAQQACTPASFYQQRSSFGKRCAVHSLATSFCMSCGMRGADARQICGT